MPTNQAPIVTYDTTEKAVVQVVTKTDKISIDRLKTTLQQINAQIAALTEQRDIAQSYLDGYKAAEESEKARP